MNPAGARDVARDLFCVCARRAGGIVPLVIRGAIGALDSRGEPVLSRSVNTVGTQRRRTPIAFVAVAVGVLLLLQFASPAFAAPRFWGLRTWEGIPFGWRACLLVFGFSLLTPAAVAVFDGLWRVERRRRAIRILALVLLPLLFMLLRSDVMWGNPDIASRDAANGRLTLKHPLATAVSAAIFWVFGRGDIYFAKTAVALNSALAGALYVWGAFEFGAAVFPRSLVKSRVIAMTLATAGLMQQFFGVVESYALSTVAQIWVLVFIARLARAKEDGGCDSPTPALLALGLSVATFIATIFLAPATLLAIFRKRARGVVPPLRRVWVPVAAALAPIAVVAAILHLLGITGVGYRWRPLLETFGGADGSAWVPLSLDAKSNAFFSLFSREHLAARMNLAFLVAPAWLPLVAGIASLAPEKPFASAVQRLMVPLALAALGALSFFFLVHPDLGPTIDWMQTMEGTIAPLAFLLVCALARTSEATASRIGTLVVGSSLIHTLPWVMANAGLTGGAS